MLAYWAIEAASRQQAALVGQVDAELFKAVGLQTFKAVDVQGPCYPTRRNVRTLREQRAIFHRHQETIEKTQEIMGKHVAIQEQWWFHGDVSLV